MSAFTLKADILERSLNVRQGPKGTSPYSITSPSKRLPRQLFGNDEPNSFGMMSGLVGFSSAFEGHERLVEPVSTCQEESQKRKFSSPGFLLPFSVLYQCLRWRTVQRALLH